MLEALRPTCFMEMRDNFLPEDIISQAFGTWEERIEDGPTPPRPSWCEPKPCLPSKTCE